MSFRSNNDRKNRDGSRINSRPLRQEWVPRGGGSSSTAATDTLTNPTSSFNSDPVRANDGEVNFRGGGLAEYRNRGNFARRNYVLRYSKKEGEGEGNSDRESTVTRDLNVPQLVQEIHEKLLKGTVECMICYDMVRRSAPIWSCSSCYSIFHLNCIKKWARAPTSVDLSATEEKNWRCPGCQSVQLISAKEIRYICFCGKRPDPPSDLYLTPHSCGEPCGKPLGREGLGGNDTNDDDDQCRHICVLQCHPGPCPPCKAFAPSRLCPCGKKTITTRCSDRKSVHTCGQLCDKVLECGRHGCQRVCHKGPCDPCQELINATCFCKKETLVALCGEMVVKGELKESDGIFSCDSVCGKSLDCGNHVCHEICHPGSCGECELMPWRIKTCNCGKTNLQKERQSCLDPIPTCTQICGKPLPCRIHYCKDVCHVGDCAPCMVIISQSCRCRSSNQTVECYRTMEEKEKFVCEKPCGRKKNCGRHRCSDRCCPLSNSNRLFGDWDPHSCSMTCGKKLRCGQHSCESLCHSGHCPPCLETIFVDLTCACGKTSIPPPLPCSTPPPSCQHPCMVPQPCGHNALHSCHFGDCPPCSVPVAKECIGGHVFLRNIPCGSKDIRCNQLCGNTRKCGMHACGRTCHPPPCDPPCESGSLPGTKASCGQVCGAPRRDCRHTCTVNCHPSATCPDLRCDFPVTITCACGRITATVPCDAGGSSHIDSVFEASVLQKLPVPLQPVEANGKKVPLGQRKLACDEECVKMERKRVLADAFDISPPNLDTLHIGENSIISELLADMFRRDPKWVMSIEERFKFLVLGKNKGGTTNGLKVHVFCPMLKDKRDIVRHMAERWKLSVHAAGWEPKCFLVVHVTPKSKVPARVLGSKGSVSMNMSLPLAFDPLVDMDPRLVVALMDLPRDADISALVLRFGGECELVWLNDKNALAVFSDPARAATALRRLDHGSAYHGAAAFLHNGGTSAGPLGSNAWGGLGANKEGGAVMTAAAVKANPWKKTVVQENIWKQQDSWGSEDRYSSATDTQASLWKGQDALIVASRNQWNILDSDTVSKSVASSAVPTAKPANGNIESSTSSIELESKATSSSVVGQCGDAIGEQSEVVDDWEEVCE